MKCEQGRPLDIGSCVDMLHDSGRFVENAPSTKAHSPAQVSVLVVQEECLVEQANVIEGSSIKEYCSSTCGEDLLPLRILTTIRFSESSIHTAAVTTQRRTRALNHVWSIEED